MSNRAAYYQKNKERLREYAARYRVLLKSDPVAYAASIEKARLYKRKRFGWIRTYHARSLP